MGRKCMNKKIVAIIVAAVIGGQLPISVLATPINESRDKLNSESAEILTNSDEEAEAYIQNYDRPEGITWTK
ncbi:MAG: hypothetical protein E7B46_16575, partial [Clostridium perfringens]|nr:hypothetical protein [Clostridium perfringens]